MLMLSLRYFLNPGLQRGQTASTHKRHPRRYTKTGCNLHHSLIKPQLKEPRHSPRHKRRRIRAHSNILARINPPLLRAIALPNPLPIARRDPPGSHVPHRLHSDVVREPRVDRVVDINKVEVAVPAPRVGPRRVAVQVRQARPVGRDGLVDAAAARPAVDPEAQGRCGGVRVAGLEEPEEEVLWEGLLGRGWDRDVARVGFYPGGGLADFGLCWRKSC